MACQPTSKPDITTGGSSSANLDARWRANSFPKTVGLSINFTLTERELIRDSAEAWDTASQINHFTLNPNSTVTDVGNPSNLKALLDNKFEIYRNAIWQKDLPRTALAVAQIWGVRKDDYLEIVEADILFNNNFRFFPADASGYDIRFVAVHELGHFLGLPHSSFSTNSVMIPAIDPSDRYFPPTATDIDNLTDLYSTSSLTGRSIASLAEEYMGPAATKDEVLNSGKGFRLMIELYPSGECVHRLDGVETHRHTFTDLKGR